MNGHEQIETLAANLESLPSHNLSFAKSLIHQYTARRKLSEKQWDWVERLMRQATEPKESPEEPREQVKVGELDGIQKLFEKAIQNGIPRPSIKFAVGEYIMRLAYHRDGRIFINRSEQNFYWITLGYITIEGFFREYPDKRSAQPEGMFESIKELIANPSAFGRAQGQKLNWCIFCSRELRTTDSVFYGYGPICAEKWGLEWGNAAERIKEKTLEEFNCTQTFNVGE